MSHTQTYTHTHTNTLSFRHLCAEMNVILIKHIKPPHVLCDLTSVFLWRRATLKPTNLAANHFSFSFALCTLYVFMVVTFLNTGLYVPVTLQTSSALFLSSPQWFPIFSSSNTKYHSLLCFLSFVSGAAEQWTVISRINNSEKEARRRTIGYYNFSSGKQVKMSSSGSSCCRVN